MATSFFLFLGCDIAILAGRAFPSMPLFGHTGPVPVSLRRAVLILVSLLTVLVVTAGTLNSLFPRTREPSGELSRGSGKPLRVVFFSDLHMGPLVGNGRVRALVERVNALRPDIVLLGGDIVDEDVSRLAEEKMAEAWENFRPGWEASR
jgi:predicted MPP superfamily phosphohydrolase